MSSAPSTDIPPLEAPASDAGPVEAPSVDPATLQEAKIVTLVVVGVLSLIAAAVPWILSRKCIRHSECIPLPHVQALYLALPLSFFRPLDLSFRSLFHLSRVVVFSALNLLRFVVLSELRRSTLCCSRHSPLIQWRRSVLHVDFSSEPPS